MMGVGGGSDFFGSESLAKSDFFWSIKDTGIFLGREQKQGFLGVVKKALRDSVGYAKKSSAFWGKQILMLGFFGV